MGANIKFNPSHFKAAILRHGFQVLLEKHQMCVCYGEETSEADPTCPYCGGLHFIWRPYGVIPSLIVGVKEVKNQAIDFIKVSQGDVTLTTMPDEKLAINDRIRLVHSPEIYSETIEAEYNSNGEKVFIPFYEVAIIDFVTGTTNEEIPLSSVSYDLRNDEIKISGYVGDRISIRYRHYPFLLVSDLIHSNRQQWTSEVGSGTLQNLPNQYIAKRITTKLKVAYKQQLIESSVYLDLLEVIKNLSHAYNPEFYQGDDMKYAPLQIIPTQYFDIFERDKRSYYTTEMFFIQKENGNIITLEDAYDETLEIKSPVQSINDILKFKGFIEPGDSFIYLRDKYAVDYTFSEFKDGSILTYLGGDLESPSSWEATLPTNKLRTISDFDFINNVDCEILVKNPTEYIYLDRNAYWHKRELTFKLFVEDFNLKLSLGDAVYDLGTKIKDSKNYLCLLLNNFWKLNNSSIYLNGEIIRIPSTVTVNGLGSNKDATILDENGSLISFRIYSKMLDSFEMQQNMNYLINATD